MSTLPQIDVVEIQPIASGNARARATVQIGGEVTIRCVLVISRPGEAPFVVMPSRRYWAGKDRLVFEPIVQLPPATFAEVESAVLAAWAEMGR